MSHANLDHFNGVLEVEPRSDEQELLDELRRLFGMRDGEDGTGIVQRGGGGRNGSAARQEWL